MAADPKKTPKKRVTPPTNCDITPTSVAMLADSMTVVVITIATASFRIDSPNTNICSTGSASSAWKIARVATGSTAEIREPKAKL